MRSPRILSLLAVLVFSLLVWLYVREFAVLSNTLEVKTLAIGSMLIGGLLVGGLIWYKRDRFTPWDRHFPEVLLILVFSILFAPLFGSLLNRSLGSNQEESVDFVAETAYFASGYGILKGEKLKPTGWRLTVRENGHVRHFKYKSQAYFPLTKTGDPILLPIWQGLFGIRVMQLR